MDIRAKERLTGAVILVALVVLVVPELLSGPGRSAARPQAAGDEPPLRSVRLELGDGSRGATALHADTEDSGPASGAAPPAQSSQPPIGQSSALPAAPGTQPPPPGQGSQSPAAPGAQSPPPAQGSPAQRTHGGAPAHTRQAAAHAVRPERSARARPLDGHAWTVQVGSFKSRALADRLVHRLRMAGFTAFVGESVTRGQRWYRVRVGPERDRTAARAMAVRLHAAGHAGSVEPP